MKLIEAMKQTKELRVKIDDLKDKISKHHVHLSIESPLYGQEQKSKIEEWLQSMSDSIKEILRLRVAIQKTNLATKVDIKLGDKVVTKTIAEWVHRRRDLAELEMKIWESLNDRKLQEGYVKDSMGEQMEIKIVRYYDPQLRDRKVEEYRQEPSIIDRTLEVVNAVTDVIE